MVTITGQHPLRLGARATHNVKDGAALASAKLEQRSRARSSPLIREDAQLQGTASSGLQDSANIDLGSARGGG